MTHVEPKVAINPTPFLTVTVELDTTGLDHFGFEVS